MKVYRVMIINALVLIAIGVYGYATSGSSTALIAPGIGVILLGIAFWARNDNSAAVHTGVVLTTIAMIMFFVTGFMRSNTLVIVMAVFTLLALIFYISNFIKRKKEREAAGKV